jgi:hypothetical protein
LPIKANCRNRKKEIPLGSSHPHSTTLINELTFPCEESYSHNGKASAFANLVRLTKQILPTTMSKLAQGSGWLFNVEEDARNMAARPKAKGITLSKGSGLQVVGSSSRDAFPSDGATHPDGLHHAI